MINLLKFAKIALLQKYNLNFNLNIMTTSCLAQNVVVPTINCENNTTNYCYKKKTFDYNKNVIETITTF